MRESGERSSRRSACSSTGTSPCAYAPLYLNVQASFCSPICSCLNVLLHTISESCDDCRVEDSRKVQKVVLSERDWQLDERKRIEEEEVRLVA